MDDVIKAKGGEDKEKFVHSKMILDAIFNIVTGNINLGVMAVCYPHSGGGGEVANGVGGGIWGVRPSYPFEQLNVLNRSYNIKDV